MTGTLLVALAAQSSDEESDHETCDTTPAADVKMASRARAQQLAKTGLVPPCVRRSSRRKRTHIKALRAHASSRKPEERRNFFLG